MKRLALDPPNECTYLASPSPRKGKMRIGKSQHVPIKADPALIRTWVKEYRKRWKDWKCGTEAEYLSVSRRAAG